MGAVAVSPKFGQKGFLQGIVSLSADLHCAGEPIQCAALFMSKNLHVAIVGATGAVGVEMIKTLEKRNFPVGKLTLLASARSVGKTLPFRGSELTITELREDSFAGVDMALFSAGSGISKKFAPFAVQAGAVVVDNSSAFRMDPDVPLVIPEINGGDIKKNRGIIANPNCTTAITLMALYPLHQEFRVKRIFAASYQAVSGTGAQAIEELRAQVHAVVQWPARGEERLSAPDRLQRAAARRFLPRNRLHEGRDEDAERRPAHHAPPDLQGLGDVRARAGLSRAQRGGECRIREARLAQGRPRGAGPGARPRSGG